MQDKVENSVFSHYRNRFRMPGRPERVAAAGAIRSVGGGCPRTCTHYPYTPACVACVRFLEMPVRALNSFPTQTSGLSFMSSRRHTRMHTHPCVPHVTAIGESMTTTSRSLQRIATPDRLQRHQMPKHGFRLEIHSMHIMRPCQRRYEYGSAFYSFDVGPVHVICLNTYRSCTPLCNSPSCFQIHPSSST